ncbi:hypothetical protein HETIRDRAFT_317294 [Heterobasidion irregulare TC 32-1]|uniref:Large ribosomal subunit protein uL29m n=1 Tax=Heterobasidion irregulare (strain TC 32-1) TaxID=747525 RepID=W4K868_HETIT|nr:uncharacterized protein HETIRDRAFT_317294 [Heterobasidion irregulare TC 32-1]ETW81545.1 hypothetical protein HETIRDRAFT_317294 [Heterobasidion irregulare TC 32-1]
MLSFFRSRFVPLLQPLAHCRRFSTPLDTIPIAPKADGALRPHLNIAVNPNHGLFAFFRQRERDGNIKHVSVEDSEDINTKTGRSWTAAELRRKSFRDLHTLWYVLLRERNLLATQSEELRRMGVSRSGAAAPSGTREYQCRKSMARIKYVINERRLAYEGAVAIFAEQKNARTRQDRSAKRASRLALLRKRGVETEQKEESTPTEAVQLAVEGLLHSNPRSS